MVSKPSWTNLGFLLWDIGATFLPFIPGSYVYKGGKLLVKVASKVDDLVKGIGLTIDTYKSLRKVFKGVKGIEIHHLVEKRFAKRIGKLADDIISIPISKDLHKELTKRWRQVIPYGTDYSKLKKRELLDAVNTVYHDMPDLRKAVKNWLDRVMR